MIPNVKRQCYERDVALNDSYGIFIIWFLKVKYNKNAFYERNPHEGKIVAMKSMFYQCVILEKRWALGL